MQYAIETFSLTKIFSDWWGRNRVIAVDDLNLKVKTNEVFGLLGPNGSGKTTTLKMLLGLLHPTKGKSLILEGDATDPAISKRIGFLPEESYLYRYLTARETLDFYGRLFKLPAKIRKLRIEALLDMVVLRRPLSTTPTCSFSMSRQRVLTPSAQDKSRTSLSSLPNEARRFCFAATFWQTSRTSATESRYFTAAKSRPRATSTTCCGILKRPQSPPRV
ncbi:MAG: ABC transporter ATP-binding protein [Sedimentisphaerales bacterium]